MRKHTIAAAAGALLFCVSACSPSSSARPAATDGASKPAAESGITGSTERMQPASSGNAPAPQPSGKNSFMGTVAETMSSGGYTYARLQSGGHDDVWIAAPQFDARVGEQIAASLDMPMQNFESRTLHRTFPLLYFVSEVARNGDTLVGTQQAAPPSLMTSHGAASAPTPAAVPKLGPPPGGMSIADVFARRTALSGKPVTVRGTVVKFNGGILDRNWIHIQDGSGTAASNDNDLTLTSDTPVQVGDVITASGVLGVNRDFGAGYAYEAIVEKATIQK